MNKVPYMYSEDVITIFWEGKPYSLRKDHPNFQNAKNAILEGDYDSIHNPKAIHYTNGGPWYKTWDGEYRKNWTDIYDTL